ncbi:MAG: DUF368 domain-containing protein [Micrococcales bacterium]|nr:DUF368 domain-containing protein [Micrococcales bacterium]
MDADEKNARENDDREDSAEQVDTPRPELGVVRNLANGVALGITETVPGVSGGTTAVILGFYDNLIHAINNFRKDYKKSLRFLLPIALGVVIGLLTFSSIANYLLENHSFPTMVFFIGLITGIIPLIYAKVKTPGTRFTATEVLLVAVPAVVLVVVSSLGSLDLGTPKDAVEDIGWLFMLFLLVAGMVAAAALVIPGVSGSFVLLLLGVYPLAIFAVSSLSDALRGASDAPSLLSLGKVLLPLGIGIIIGGLSMVRTIEKLLTSYHRPAYLIILGLLTGSIYAIFRQPIVFESGVSALTIAIAVVMFALGAAASFSLGRKRL